MLLRNFCFFLMISLFVACQQEFEQLPSGYYLRMVEAKGGKKPGDTDALKVHLKIALEDSVIVNSKDLFPIGRRLAINNMWPEFKDVLQRVGLGDSVQIKMSLPEYAKLEGRRAPLKDSTLMVTMSMRVLDVDNEASVIDKMVEEQLAYETDLIEKYLINNNLEAERTPEGLFYIISQKGTGPFIQREDDVVAEFSMKLLDGTVVATTNEEISRANGLHTEGRDYIPYTFTLEQSRLEGWLIGMPKFQVGSIGTLIIPSRYGFGNQSAGGVVPPNATLIYDLEILEIQ